MKNRFNFIIFFITFFFACLFDQLSKKIFADILKEKGTINVFKFFSFELVKNYGIVFGFLNNDKIKFFLIPFSIIVIFLIPLYILKTKKDEKFSQFSLGLVEGGIMGNLVDRIKNGYVVDFINFHFWPVFNLADSFITIGMILFFIKYFKE
ncbi:MAG: signal peptidase II [Candidatus Omnitrophica bacterium]|nr:signal peptidase II [Candidatus Omnitrophota bacterium]